ncbi:MAG: itaconyl-CoA hydratase [Pseudonocardiales bacterium]|nr:itaconyl-CoA hydratase [Pseudonocardiales bacterium]
MTAPPSDTPSRGAQVGDTMSLVKVATPVSMFRFSAVMWNAHRVHYDYPYATDVEGHRGLLVPAYQLASYLCEMVMKWGGPTSRVTRLTYQTLGSVYAEVEIECWGRVVQLEPGAGHRTAELEIGIGDAAADPNVLGTARVLLPGA